MKQKIKKRSKNKQVQRGLRASFYGCFHKITPRAVYLIPGQQTAGGIPYI